MGDIKPIGSEKLQGDEKFKRILELTYYNQKSSNQKTSNAELVKEGKHGVYGIVREKDGYYVKKGLNESSLDYIGGMFMKNKNKFSSYAEALKRLELLKGQEMLNEDITKYVLKTTKPTQEMPMPEPAVDSAPAPSMPPSDTEAPADSVDNMDAPMPDAEGEPEAMSPEESKRSDYMAEIQKFSGKLGQELRDQQPKMESDDIKYVLNMIISAVDLDKLDEDDIEEIGKKFERDEEMGSEEMPQADAEAPEAEPESDEVVPAPEDDLAERMSKLEELINTKFGEEPEEEALDEVYFDFEDGGEDAYDKHLTKDSEEEEDEEGNYNLDITHELSNINEAINTTLSKYFE
jgi:hypothetical protein